MLMMQVNTEKQPRFRRFAQRPPIPAIRSGPPLVTYGKRSKPLQLHGTHFLSEPELEPEPRLPVPQHGQAQQRKRSRATEPDPDDSPLSEDELEAVYNGLDASPIQSSYFVPAAVKQPGKAKAVAAERLKTKQKVPETKQTRKRHLPVDELILVASLPPDRAQQYFAEPGVGVALEQHSDPIAHTSSPQRREPTAAGLERVKFREAPLTFHRKRLKTPKFTHKSIAALRNKKRAASVTSTNAWANGDDFGVSEEIRRLGDGFDSSEVKAGRCSKVKRRKATKTLALAFESLQLQAGPLPEVEFLESSYELKIDTHSGDLNDPSQMNDWENTTHHTDELAGLNSNRDDRQVAFSDRVFDQLSAISAPRRVYSISSDDSDDEDHYDDSEVEVEEASRNGDTESRPDENEVDIQQNYTHADPPSPPRPQVSAYTPSVNDLARINPQSEPVRKSTGVTLDFRRTVTPGIPPRRSSINKARLMEVDDMIVDDPFIDRQQTSDFPSDTYLIKGQQVPTGEEASARQLRSILRNHTPNFAEGVTGKEFTYVNTRRNSAITTEDSHYFNTATSMLGRGPERARDTCRRIVTQNGNDTAAAAYFARQRREVHVIDSETAIPETSPDGRPRDYMIDSGMRMMQRSAETEASSDVALPGVPKSLEALTRSVSKDHGTLSQAIRRRPSLPFQSPTKVGE